MYRSLHTHPRQLIAGRSNCWLPVMGRVCLVQSCEEVTSRSVISLSYLMHHNFLYYYTGCVAAPPGTLQELTMSLPRQATMDTSTLLAVIKKEGCLKGSERIQLTEGPGRDFSHVGDARYSVCFCITTCLPDWVWRRPEARFMV